MKGLYANIHAKQARIKAGSGETMRKPGAKGAPTAANFHCYPLRHINTSTNCVIRQTNYQVQLQ